MILSADVRTTEGEIFTLTGESVEALAAQVADLREEHGSDAIQSGTIRVTDEAGWDRGAIRADNSWVAS